MSHTSPDDFTEKQMTKKLQIMMTNTRRKLLFPVDSTIITSNLRVEPRPQVIGEMPIL